MTSGGEAPPPPPASGRLPRPDRIGPYRIIRLLGQGGIGTVYEAARVTAGLLVRLYDATGRQGLAEQYRARQRR